MSEFRVLLSVVSHNQGSLIAQLLQDLDEVLRLGDQGISWKVVVTENTSDDAIEKLILKSKLYRRGAVQFLKNSTVLGFGSNHNRAFRSFPSDYFFVLNPDLRVATNVFSPLAYQLDALPGIVAPLIIDSSGQIQDSARLFPTLRSLVRKLVLSDGGRYPLGAEPIVKPDWLAGMFLGFNSKVFEELGGFDEQYFLYYEDVDICARTWSKGYFVSLHRNFSIIHDARRASHRNVKLALVHIGSALRYLITCRLPSHR